MPTIGETSVKSRTGSAGLQSLFQVAYTRRVAKAGGSLDTPQRVLHNAPATINNANTSKDCNTRTNGPQLGRI